jgi:hypothetical protein
MGGRLSKPKGPDGMSEAPAPTTANAQARLSRSRGIVNGRVRPLHPISIFTAH